MQGLRILGDYIVEFVTVTVLMALAAVTILPFIPMYVGVVGFFSQKRDVRRFKDIFTTIGKNIKIIIFFTLFELVIIVFPTLNLYFFNTHPQNTNYFVLAICCIALVVGVIYLVNAPIIIINMRVKFGQLLYNGLMLLFGGFWRTVIALGAAAGVVVLIMYYPYIVPLLLYPLPLLMSKLLNQNFMRLKAKALGTTVRELEKQADADNYLNEYGEVDHSDDE